VVTQVPTELACLTHSPRVDVHTQNITFHPVGAMVSEVLDLGHVVVSCSLAAAGARVL
jgi:hypothetical protein